MQARGARARAPRATVDAQRWPTVRPRLDGVSHQLHAIRMKRTNLVLDEQLLEDALRVSGERTYSAAVSRALTDFVKRARAGRILELAGSGLWEGDLSAMRDDGKGTRKPKARKRGSRAAG